MSADYMNLYVKCTLKQECLEYVSVLQSNEPCLVLPDNVYFKASTEDRQHCIPYSISDMQDLWFRLNLHHSFLQFDIDESSKQMVIYLSKKQSDHHQRDLYKDYVIFILKILVPWTTRINLCYIEDDELRRHKIFFDQDLRVH